MIRISPEAFEEWREHEMTAALFRALELSEQRIRETWLEASLEGGRCDALELARLRERRSAYRDIREITSERLEEILNG